MTDLPTAFTTARTIPARVPFVGRAVTTEDDLGDLVAGTSAAWLRARGFEGKVDQTQVVPDGDRTVVLLGLGATADVDDARLRRAAADLARTARGAAQVATDLPAAGPGGATAARSVVEGFALGSYRFSIHKSEVGDKRPPRRCVLVGAGASAATRAAIEAGEATAAAVKFARDLVNEPGGTLTPTELARRARVMARAAGVRIEVWGRREIAARKLGGLLGVNRGSAQPPVFLKLTYTPARRPRRHLALVGKGITFDAGGLSIKTAAGMMAMKTDMAGAAAVLGAFSAFKALGVSAKVTGWIPATDNMLGGDATRPGDVLRIRNGRTVEVLNTDAEGRLILADGLALAAEAKPDAVVDLATLTGACIVALGNRIAGLMGNDEDWTAAVAGAAEAAGERVWPLPLPADHRSQLDSQVADLRNIGTGSSGGALIAGLFLSEFVPAALPWAHIDIAGPASSDADDGEISRGATGFGVRTLLTLAQQF